MRLSPFEPVYQPMEMCGPLDPDTGAIQLQAAQSAQDS